MQSRKLEVYKEGMTGVCLMDRVNENTVFLVDTDKQAIRILENGGEAATYEVFLSAFDDKGYLIEGNIGKQLKFIPIINGSDHNIELFFNNAAIKGYKLLELDIDKLSDAELKELIKGGDCLDIISNSVTVRSFYDLIKSEASKPLTKTGFPLLDEAIGGGLYPGFYNFGASTGLGKTTFILQICDYIASHGTPVLYISLEMSRIELISRSISRNTYLLSKDSNSSTGRNLPKTELGIRDYRRYVNYKDDELKVIEYARKAVLSYSDNFRIKEGIGDVKADDIKSYIEALAKIDIKPVVVIDYLQILKPSEKHMTDKQAIDDSVIKLKRYSRDYNLPIIAINSFNRSGTKGSVDMSNFKESGAIEYTSDVLIAMQYAALNSMQYNTPTEKKKYDKQYNDCSKMTIQDVTITVLKNRRGKKNIKLDYSYYPAFNCFYDERTHKEDDNTEMPDIED